MQCLSNMTSYSLRDVCFLCWLIPWHFNATIQGLLLLTLKCLWVFMLRHSNECWETQWHFPDQAHCLFFQGESKIKQGGRGRRNCYSKNGQQVFIPSLTGPRIRTDLINFIVFSPYYQDDRMEAGIAAKAKKTKKINCEAHRLEWGYQLLVYRDYLPD